MNSTAIVIVILVVLLLAAVAFAGWQFWRTRRLRTRFGPEYTRTVEETGNRKVAERKLENVEKRVARLQIRPLRSADRDRFIASWRAVQAKFVDDPKNALTEADTLLGEVMAARGYPINDFESRAEDISVDHPHVVEHYRAGHEIVGRRDRGLASTEDMRQAMIHYRTLFDELVEQPVHAEAAVRTGPSL